MTNQSNPKIKTTEDLRDDILQIRQDLREGKIANAVARTLIHAAKVALDTIAVEMKAKQMGCDFNAVQMHQEDRPTVNKH
jgi:hypothetical protein